ncbi:type I restriction enzyme S subunit [Neorhizobium galegae]|uniref:restriction endonuclease subunit S n=1 Tax=Neorhizobium galegae TaxID=399 RepID=UPI002782BA78|nr:restriction endonuclease subunit S [Neorhizobium galegae]MDQ0134064.1 type I restriction enzyme S subunit [Neorhizobium galegae]
MNVVSKTSAFPATVQPGLPHLGDVPNGWCREPIGKHLKEIRRPVSMTDAEVFQLVTAKRARGGIVPRERLMGREISVKSQFWIKEGDFLISKRQIVHGACGLVPRELDGAIVSNEYGVLRACPSIEPRFLSYLSNSIYFQQTCFHSAIGVHIEKMIFKLDKWLKWKFDLPPLPEQKKIAEILSTWDSAIETTEKLLANAEVQKRALMQQLLTGKRRLKGSEGGKWRPFRLDELAQINPRTERTSGNNVTFLPMEAVSNSGQILARQERNVADLGSGYTVFSEGDILVAKITPCFENGKGCHATDLPTGMGVGSTEFHVLRARKRSDQRLLFHIVNSYEFRKRGEANMTGSAGQRRVPADYIKQFTLSLPEDGSVREMIGGVLDDAAMIETNLAIDVDRLKAEKLALMQQLLTGKRRVKE